MTSGNFDLMDLLVKKMIYLNKSQVVHSENVANANTPGYKSLDVAPFTFGDALKQASVNMAVTDPHHIVPASMKGANDVSVKPKMNGPHDAEDVEQESTKVSQVGMQYQLVTSIYHKMAGLFKIALKGNSG